MTDSQLTQCPHCKASFKVSEEQLNVANGRVRCGACLNIFDAIAYRISPPLIDHDDEDFNRKMKSLDDDLSYLEDSVDLESELLSDADQDLIEKTSPLREEIEDDTLFADDPEEDKLEKGYTGSNKFGDELSASFLELEKSSSTPFNADSHSEEVIQSKADDDTVDESWATSILDDLDVPEDNKRAPALSDSDTSMKTNSDRGILAEHLSMADDTPKKPSSDPLLDFGPSLTDTTPADPQTFDKGDLHSLSFQYEQDQPSKLKWLSWTFFAVVNLGLILTLIAQASWYHYEKLVKYPNVAAIYEFACNQLGCTLPELSDITKIENRNLVVKSHPTVFKALIIETIITNQAGFAQPFPDISLSFSDINNNIIAQRLFSPAEYLTSEVNNWPNMPSRQPIQITLEIIDPGPDAVNYKVEFYPARTDKDLQKNDQMSTNKSKI